MWDQTRYAKEVFEQIPYWEMEPLDSLVQPGGPWVLGNHEKGIYLLYFLKGASYEQELPVGKGTYQEMWLNPRNGKQYPFTQSDRDHSRGMIRIGVPPEEPEQDWALLIQRLVQ